MKIIGSGFLARNLAAHAGEHGGVVVYAAGPSGGAATDQAAFGRDADRLYGVLRECRADGRRLVYLSTASVGLYGRQGGRGVETGPVFPCSAYGLHKLAMEAVVRAAGVDHLVLRVAYPVGEHQPAHQIVPALIAQLRTGEVTVWRGARRDLIDVVHVAAIVDGLVAAGVSGETVNVASGFAVPVEHIVAHLADRLRVRPATVFRELPADDDIAVDRLRELVPAVGGFGFGPGYYRQVLDRYVPAPVPEVVS